MVSELCALAVPVPAATPHLITHFPDRFLGNAEEDFPVWLGKFEIYADAHQYTPDVRVRILPTFLDGPALTYLQALDQDVRRDYSKLLAALSQAFSQDRYTFTFRQSLAQRRRQPGESFMVFAAELTRLVRRAHPTYNEPAIRGQTLQHFIQGVDPATRLRVMERGAPTIDEAVEIATLYERTGSGCLCAAGHSSEWVQAYQSGRNPAAHQKVQQNQAEARRDKRHLRERQRGTTSSAPDGRP
uniref:Retrotransposon gag domain-containing protein n=1 Tax=Branchiostoma floridae TaxID=7739 RepID=C3ZXN1_BRAFL|eukprot:XP_002586683.1 hypothetical protein BRAFLDRAFT_105490 [Branchiostoma floridae]